MRGRARPPPPVRGLGTKLRASTDRTGGRIASPRSGADGADAAYATAARHPVALTSTTSALAAAALLLWFQEMNMPRRSVRPGTCHPEPSAATQGLLVARQIQRQRRAL